MKRILAGLDWLLCSLILLVWLFFIDEYELMIESNKEDPDGS